MAYRLYYFPFRGRGEQVRLFCHALGVPFEDVRVGKAEFTELRALGPGKLAFGSLPMLDDDGFCLVQGPAIMGYLATKHGARPSDVRDAARCDALVLGAEDLRIRYFRAFGEDQAKQREFVEGDLNARWLPRLQDLLERNGSDRHFVGRALSAADVAIWDVLDAVTTFIPGATLAGRDKLQAFRAAFAAQPSITTYLAARPEK